MSTKSTAAKGRNSKPSSARKAEKPPEPEISADDVDLMRTASDNVATSVATLRAMVACFDNDGQPRAEGKDVAVGVRIGRKALRSASDALFSFPYGTPANDRAQPLLESLWDSVDIVYVVETVLDRGKLPEGDITCCPVRGALSVAVTRLEELHESIKANLAQMETELGASVQRYNRKYGLKLQREART
jgi:hypothetical protein